MNNGGGGGGEGTKREGMEVMFTITVRKERGSFSLCWRGAQKVLRF